MAAPYNKALEIINDLREGAGLPSMTQTIRRALVASCDAGNNISNATAKKLIPLIRLASRHLRCSQQDKIKFAEMVKMITLGAAAGDVLTIFDGDGTRAEAAARLERVELVNTEARDQSLDNVPVVASQSGLLEEAQAITRSRGADAVFSVEDVLKSFDQRLQLYAKPASVYRPLSEVRAELAQYLELDTILAEAVDSYGESAKHRINMMALVPAGPEPLFVRQLRWRCQTDLMFLARVCGKRLTNFTHRKMCEHLVQKNPTLGIQDQSPIKDRLTLAPRGSFKSTVSTLDILQFIICFPDDIRIIVATATTKLASRLVAEVKSYFTKPDGANPTMFQLLFPEFVVESSKDGRANEFTVKGRKSNLKDPTLWAESATTSNAGTHADYLVCDDIQSPENVGTEETLENLRASVNMLRALIEPNSFRSFIGTPLQNDDIYMNMRKTWVGLQTLYEPAMVRKEESLSKDEGSCEESDWNFLFPERLTYDFLMSVKREDIGLFKSQYQLDPRGVTETSFPIELLLAQTIDIQQVPHKITYCVTADIAYSQSSHADKTAIAISAIDESGRVYIVDLRHERFTPTEIAKELVGIYSKYRPLQIIIENSNGANILDSIIRQEAEKQNIMEHLPLQFLKVENRKNAKHTRIGVLESLLRRQLLFFVNNLDDLDELYKQFSEFQIYRKDDIPDVISLLYSSGAARLIPNVPDPAVERELRKDADYRAFHDMIFGSEEKPIFPEVKLEEEYFEPQLDDPYTAVGLRYPATVRPAGSN